MNRLGQCMLATLRRWGLWHRCGADAGADRPAGKEAHPPVRGEAQLDITKPETKVRATRSTTTIIVRKPVRPARSPG